MFRKAFCQTNTCLAYNKLFTSKKGGVERNGGGKIVRNPKFKILIVANIIVKTEVFYAGKTSEFF